MYRNLRLKWSAFEKFVSERNKSVQWFDNDTHYHLIVFDGQLSIESFIHKTEPASSEQLVFETKYKKTLGSLELTTSDNRKILTSNRIPVGYTIYICGISDDIVDGLYGSGEELLLTKASPKKTLRMLDHYYAIGGRAMWYGMASGPYMDAKLYAPASTGFADATGDFNKLTIATGVNIIVPTEPGSGNIDVNLEATLNGNVTILANTPVPSPGNQGFFDYNSDTNELSVNYEQKGGYNLFDVPIDLFYFMRRGRGPANGVTTFESTDVVGKLLYNSWAMEFEMKNVGSLVGPEVAILLTLGTKKNTNI